MVRCQAVTLARGDSHHKPGSLPKYNLAQEISAGDAVLGGYWGIIS